MNDRIINFISGPRNISTAIMYSFAQRSDTTVVDEPYYAAYLRRSGKDHPGREEILASQSDDPQIVWQQLRDSKSKPNLFIKNMAHHLIDLPKSLWVNWQNVFLIRDPHDLITSFAQVIQSPEMIDIGVKAEWDLFESLRAANHEPVVIDSGELLKSPSKVMQQLCELLGLSFEQEMLSWPAGPRPEDGVWAKYWYKNVHKSQGFSAQRKTRRIMPDHCIALYEEALPYYQSLYEKSIKA